MYRFRVIACYLLWYCIKTAKHRMMQIMQHDSPGTLVFAAKDHGEIQRG